ncbi:SRPBCC family protein [Sphingobacterium mizutaii]|uniref:SRPBCC family protein n=1 Tax=Sphingobacterium mizutaii TaxID=1010 RepID=UPI00162887B6|nr:SRPBCC family protein [Sphingobacterium mizutaii]
MRNRLYREQQLNCDVEEAWRFFSSPNNLSKITPKGIGFTVLSEYVAEEIAEGTIIDYIVSPLLTIPLKWRTRITHVEHNKCFIDLQEKGPYKYWRHLHEFFPNKDGVLMKDTVDYELPFGLVGQIAHLLLVKRKLTDIFDFRRDTIEKLFNPINN